MSLLRRWFERKTIQPGSSGEVMMPAFKRYSGLRAINVEYNALTIVTRSILPWVESSESVVWNLKITSIFTNGFRETHDHAISEVSHEAMLRLAYLRGVKNAMGEIRRHTDQNLRAIQ